MDLLKKIKEYISQKKLFQTEEYIKFEKKGIEEDTICKYEPKVKVNQTVNFNMRLNRY